jgi:HAMP domain-containing protein
VLFILLDIMLVRLVIKPLGRMANAADEISKGNLEIAEFDENSGDEVSQLGTSFNRMRRSLVKAMAMFNKTSGPA